MSQKHDSKVGKCWFIFNIGIETIKVHTLDADSLKKLFCCLKSVLASEEISGSK